MKKFLKEFETFIMRGNVIDMAVGVIVGAAFQAIVSSLVNDVISPILGLVANMDLSYLVLKVNDVEIRYGAFITSVINFLIMAFVIFLLVKLINKISELGFKKKAEEEAPSAPKTKICPYCKSEIPIDAVKCCHCTSDLTEETQVEEQVEKPED
ncbi:MAG TPA: large conductance mechanosensitive channel protein MscL [Candidatus Eisenbergiella merdavium]|uniref:Large-conductance mechanosensitive channel n=2 Tax=Eisenbergiella TaxID=1432051 RepID=A0A9D2MSV4_9FIRM|nr:large conductance mechanosensitive channel protein MscL [Candidatus Eisenbergiella merdigallinarum]HJC22268.1 large conductance mechanosensitive channel protein MscL [Candidatus Eisenbergiella merdavium]